MKEWFKNKNDFEEFDVRTLKGNFLQAIVFKAKQTKKGKGLLIIQNFEPIPLYSTIKNLGFDYHIEKDAENNYYCYFDPRIADLTVNFWDNIWNKENPAIELKFKLLISLANAVGLGRIRQATREIIKAYYLGITVEQLEEVFSLIIWNQGIGHFSSEIAQSSFFKVFLLIKESEKKGKKRDEIMNILHEKFGEKNPEMGFNN